MNDLQEMNLLKFICAPIQKYLEEKGDPYTEVVVSAEGISIKQCILSMPEKAAGYEPTAENHAAVDLVSNEESYSNIDIARIIDDQPTINSSTQPERKRGLWISNDIDPEAWNFCSACGEQAIDLFDFCPNCGADMRGEQHE